MREGHICHRSGQSAFYYLYKPTPQPRIRFVALLLATSALIAASCADAQATSTPTNQQAQPLGADIATDEASAEPTEPGQGEIVVTARRREETLLSVPVAVSALTSEGINRYVASDLTRIADNVPSVQITRAASGSGALVAIRGIYSATTDPGLESSVGINIDGVMLSRGYVVQAAFFDLRQVEVLKGPQALFFGKNSPAGVISLSSNGPRSALEGYARGGYEFRANERYLEGAIGGPITSTLGLRVAGRFSEMDGWLTNTAGPTANPLEPAFPLPGAVNNRKTPAARSLVGRLTGQWSPDAALKATLKVLYSDYRDNELSGQTQALRCGGRGAPTTLGRLDTFGECTPDNRRSVGGPNQAIFDVFPFARGRFFTTNKSFLTSLGVEADFKDLTLNTITGYYNLSSVGFGNYDGTVYAFLPTVFGEKSDILTQEARLTSSFPGAINFMIGGYFERSKRESFAVVRGGFGFPVPFDPGFDGASVAAYPDDFVRSNTYSAFMQGLLDLTETVQLSGGVRYTKESKRAHLENIYVNPLLPGAVAALLPVGTVLPGRFRDDNWSPEVSLTWRPTADHTLYVSYKSGYKSGGFSTTPTLLRPRFAPGCTNFDTQCAGLQFGSETAKGGEVGYKTQLFDRRLVFTSALFSYRFNNLQRSSLDTATVNFLVRNAAASRSSGAEAEASFQVTREFNLRASATYNDAHYIRFDTAPCYVGQTAATGCNRGVINPATGNGNAQDISGNQLALAPRFNASAGATFDTPVTDGIALGLTGDVKYVSGYRTQDDGTPGAYQNGYAKFNASARLHDVDDRWELSLIGVNLFNKYAILTSTLKPGGAPGDLLGVVERGREVRLQAGYRF